MQAYTQILEELLARLRREVDAQSTMAKIPGEADIDQYLLHINSFYYQSFLEHYLPLYQQRWHQEVKELLMLSQQQGVLETNIMSTLKRYTRLHNLLKTLLQSIQVFFHINEQEARLMQEETMRQGTELLLVLTDLEHQLQSLQTYLLRIVPYLEDQELMSYLAQYPGYAAILNVAEAPFQGPARCPRALIQAISEVTYLIALLNSPVLNNQAGQTRLAMDMQQRIKHLKAANDSDDPISAWITGQFTLELSLYCQALLSEQTAADIKALILERLKGWQKFLQLRASNQLSPGAELSSLMFMGPTSAESLQESLRDVEFALNQLGQLTTALQHNPEPSYQILVQVREWLAFWSPFLRSMSNEAEVRQTPHLNALLHQARGAISMLSHQLSMIETARRRSAYNQDQVERMRTLAETQLAHLGQLKSDLDRLLAPRNVARTWKDMGVRLVKVPLQNGQAFPSDYIHLLEQARWEPRTDTSRPDYTILHEEGDLFIIQVLNEEQVEIPFMILTRQPSAQEV